MSLTDEKNNLLKRTDELRREKDTLARVEILSTKLCELLELKRSLVFSKNQTRSVTYARSILAFTLSQGGYTYSEIGRLLNRDHTTIMYYCHKLEARLLSKNNPDNTLISHLRFMRLLNSNITDMIIERNLKADA